MEDYLIEHAGRAHFFTVSGQYFYRLDGVLRALVEIFRSEKKIRHRRLGSKCVSLFHRRAEQ